VHSFVKTGQKLKLPKTQIHIELLLYSLFTVSELIKVHQSY